MLDDRHIVIVEFISTKAYLIITKLDKISTPTKSYLTMTKLDKISIHPFDYHQMANTRL